MDIFEILLKYKATLRILPAVIIGSNKSILIEISNKDCIISTVIEAEEYSSYFTPLIRIIANEFMKETRCLE